MSASPLSRLAAQLRLWLAAARQNARLLVMAAAALCYLESCLGAFVFGSYSVAARRIAVVPAAAATSTLAARATATTVAQAATPLPSRTAPPPASASAPPATATVPTSSPTAASPTPPCVQPRLQLGRVAFPVEVLSLPPGGALPSPVGPQGLAYWLDGTTAPYTFVLNPTAVTLGLRTGLAPGASANVLWGDCSVDEFQVLRIQPGLPANLGDLEPSGLAVLVLAALPGDGFVIVGARLQAPTAAPAATPTPPSGATATAAAATRTQPSITLQADIEFQDVSPSADGTMLDVSLTVTNRGSTALTIAPGDIGLRPAGGGEVLPLSTEPALPLRIAPGASQDLLIHFPRPPAGTATFRLKDFTVDLNLQGL